MDKEPAKEFTYEDFIKLIGELMGKPEDYIAPNFWFSHHTEKPYFRVHPTKNKENNG